MDTADVSFSNETFYMHIIMNNFFLIYGCFPPFEMHTSNQKYFQIYI